MTEKTPKTNKTVGFGWCGCYTDGELGWLLSRFIHRQDSVALDSEQLAALSGSSRTIATNSMYRVKVTLEVVKNKRTGKPIMRKAKA